MNITYLIGNGFDLNIGLKTSYKSFYEYYILQQTRSNLIKSFKFDLDSNLEKWADLEKALGEYTEKIKSIDDFTTIYYDIYDNLADYIEAQESKLPKLKNVSLLSKDLIFPEKYLPPLWLNDIKNFRNNWNNSSQWTLNIISFNYTKTIETLLNFNGSNVLELGSNIWGRPIFLSSIKHIHGLIGKNMLLGVNDSSQIRNESLRANNTCQNILIKPQTNKMLKELIDTECKNIIHNSNLICLFGSSLGDTDKIWWEAIGERLKNDNCKIIYFHKGEPINNRRFHLKGEIEIKLKNLLLSKTKLTLEEKKIAIEKIYIGYNSKIFSLDTSLSISNIFIQNNYTQNKII